MLPLKKARIESDWTQEELASVCGITTVTISNLERGVTRPQALTKKRLETVLGPIDWKRTEDEGLINSNGAFTNSRNGTRNSHEALN